MSALLLLLLLLKRGPVWFSMKYTIEVFEIPRLIRFVMALATDSDVFFFRKRVKENVVMADLVRDLEMVTILLDGIIGGCDRRIICGVQSLASNLFVDLRRRQSDENIWPGVMVEFPQQPGPLTVNQNQVTNVIFPVCLAWPSHSAPR
jgi:hypothetical protein